MKTLYKKILLVILSCSFVFIGCKKGIFSPNTKMLSNYPDEIQELYENMPVRDYSSIQVIGDGILKFQSMSHYENTCEQLKNDCELWNNLFYNQYDELDEDQIADWEEEVQFDEFLPIMVVALRGQPTHAASTLKDSLRQRDASRNAVLMHLIHGHMLVIHNIIPNVRLSILGKQMIGNQPCHHKQTSDTEYFFH